MIVIVKSAAQDFTPPNQSIRGANQSGNRDLLLNSLVWSCPIVEVDIPNKDRAFREILDATYADQHTEPVDDWEGLFERRSERIQNVNSMGVWLPITILALKSGFSMSVLAYRRIIHVFRWDQPFFVCRPVCLSGSGRTRSLFTTTAHGRM